ncbi:MAG: hypothetical protein WC325_06250 [Candidatus Bathyarchaeia archaeon]|jgi:hypothetical protein
MAKRRRPSIPLIILFVVLLLLFFLAGTLVDLASSLSGEGTITYSYLQGTNEIVSITYNLPQDVAESITPKQVAGWTANLAGNSLSLTGGTLSPGQSVTVNFGLTEYIASGTRTVTTTSTTSTGATFTTESALQVPEAVLLGLMWALYQNSIWLLILAIVVLAVTVLLFLKGKNADEKEQQKE